ncbi:hypothetical protein ACQEU5_23095 [Marinactinospora thermotolerans]|uniref:hypothetical protein n=1 Tax=Marinactinospora thermotolerans TaxID=531310 RepID=UPI003D8A3F54
MEAPEPPVGAPEEVPSSTAVAGPRYRLDRESVAVHSAGETVSVVQGPPLRLPPGSRVGPVYRRTPGGEVVVPTGRLHVRFAEGERAEEQRAELAGIGVVIDRVPAYAPHTAWVRGARGDIAESLRLVERLAALDGVRNVEPEMLGERAWR